MLAIDPFYLDLLPAECKTAYNDPISRQKISDESSRFEEFMTKLAERENWSEQLKDEEIESLVMDFDLRDKVYGGVENANCTMPSENFDDYVDCMSRYRDLMIDVISGTE